MLDRPGIAATTALTLLLAAAAYPSGRSGQEVVDHLDFVFLTEVDHLLFRFGGGQFVKRCESFGEFYFAGRADRDRFQASPG